MSTGQTVLLGAIAGLTIFLGLPMGRVRMESHRTKTFLAGISAGILVFLFFDILENATEQLENAVNAHAYARLTGLGVTFAIGLGVGLLGAADIQASWGWLVTAGIIAGGPTFLGTLVGTSISSTYVFVAFLALAAGAILYVVGELFNAGRRMSWEITLWGVLVGFLVGLATELVLVAAGV